MGRITERFQELRRGGGKALIPFITAGDPDLAFTGELIVRLEEMGADLLELGVPFSDPLADGPTIQRASFRSLKRGTSLRKILALVGEVRQNVRMPLLLMTYYNPVFAMGEEVFVEEAIGAGVDGVIIPDLPLEEAGPFLEVTRNTGLDLISMLAPTSPPERCERICASARGFIYYVAQMGVTGAREGLAGDLRDALTGIKALTDVPLAAGFGIKTPEQARETVRHCDGVIVGSALLDALEQAGRPDAKLRAAGEFVQSLKKGIS